MRIVINALCIKHRKVLLVRKNETWILPGGKPENNEEHLDCLLRELGEELPDTMFLIGDLYGHFQGNAPHTEDKIEVWVYRAVADNALSPSREINDARYFTVVELANINLSAVTKRIIDSLITKGHL